MSGKQPFRRYVTFALLACLFVFGLTRHSFAETRLSGQETADQVATLSRVAVYNLDTDQLHASIQVFLDTHKYVNALEVFESIENEKLISFYRDKTGKALFNEPLPDSILKLAKFKADIVYEGEKIGSVFVYYESPNPLGLSKDEIAFLKAHKRIKIGVDTSYPPFEFLDKNGAYRGIAREYLDVLAQLLDINFVRVGGLDWDQVKEGLRTRKVDLAPVISKTPEREAYMNFTADYLDFPIAIVTRQDTQDVKSLKDLRGRKIAIPKGYSDLVEIPKIYPTITFKVVETPLKALEAVATGEADAAHGNIAVLSYLMGKNSLVNLRIAGISEIRSGAHAMGIRKDWPEFQSILNKALSHIGQDIHQKIRSKWLGLQLDKAEALGTVKVELTEEEKNWLVAHPQVSIGVEEWYPFIRSELDNSVGGIAGDFVKLVQAKSGINFKVVSGKWGDLLEDFRQGKIDVLPATYYTDERAEYGLYSPGYFSAKEFLYIRENDTSIKSFEDLAGKKIAIVRDFGTIPKIREKFPDIEIVETDSQLASLYAVLNGEVDATFESQIVIEDLIRKEFIVGIRGISQSSFDASSLHFFTRLDEPLLQSVITKVLDSITDRERGVILDKWIIASTGSTSASPQPIFVEYDQESFVLKYVAVFFGVLIVILVGVWFYKGRPKYFSVRDQLFLISFLYVGLIVAIGALATMLLDTDREQRRIEDMKEASNRLAQELKQSSDELTRFARTYAITGDERYAQYFKMILLIRDGKMTHPKNFTSSFWDKMAANTIEFEKGGETYSIENRMAEIGLTQQEQSLLREAKDNSDELVNLERVAMNAVKGLYRGEDGEFSVHKEPDLRMAALLLHGREYHEAKAKIMVPLDYFFQHLKLRTANALQVVRDKNEAIMTSIIVLTLVTIIFSIYVFFLLRRRVILPLAIFEKAANQIAEGKYSRRIPLQSRDEFGALAIVFNNMTEAIEDRTRELNFQKFAMDRHAIVSSTDADGNITYINDRFLKVSGYEREELMGHNHRILKSDVHTSAYYENMWETITGGKVWHGELCNRTRDGHLVWLAATIVPFMGDDHKPDRYISISTDITARKESEATIHDREKRLQSVIDNAVDGIIIIDAKGVVQSYSPAAQRIFGYKESEVIGQNISMLMPQNIAQEHDSYLSGYLVGERRNVVGNNREVQGQRKDGHVFPMDLAVGVSKIGEESIYTGIVRDITVRKEIEAAIEESEARVRLILSSVGEGVFGVDMQGRITFVNPQTEDMLGYASHELIGQKAHPLFHYHRADGTHYPVEECWMYRSFTYGEHHRIDNEVLWCKDGSPLQIEYNATPMRKDGEIVGAVISFSDITIRKEAEHKLKDAYEVISSSITYASQIQQSALPDHTFLQPLVEDYFLWWEPRDVVGGDLYWVGPWGNGCLVLLGDCTGHGVPGAFMTLIAISALERAMSEINGGEVGRLISRTHQYIQTMLGQHYAGGETDDGIELGACYFVPGDDQLIFSGARFDLMITKDGENEIVKGTKSGMGYRNVPYTQQYQEVNVDVLPGRQFYMASDGVGDQIGGERGRMYGRKKMLRFLAAHGHLPMAEQKQKLMEELKAWQGEQARRDDISVMGLRFLND